MELPRRLTVLPCQPATIQTLWELQTSIARSVNLDSTVQRALKIPGQILVLTPHLDRLQVQRLLIVAVPAHLDISVQRQPPSHTCVQEGTIVTQALRSLSHVQLELSHLEMVLQELRSV